MEKVSARRARLKSETLFKGKVLLPGAMKKLLLLAAFTISGCSSSNDVGNVTKQLSDDFFVTVADIGGSLPGSAVLKLDDVSDKTSCEKALTRAVCETNATAQQISYRYNSIQCGAKSAQYVPALMEIYEEMPERMRLSLCTLDRVFISDGITSTAFASSVTDSFGTTTGGYIGMRKATFLAQPTSAQIVSWKEQLAFGGSTEFLANDPKLVQINYDLKMSVLKSDGLFYVLMHELGHLIDFNNNVNSRSGWSTDWSKMSWSDSESPIASATFLHRDDFCFYNCQSYLNPSDAKAIYDSLSQSAFVTTYAAQTPYEDFAENWAWHMMEISKSPNYTITVPGQGTVDMNEVFRANPKVRAKMDVVEQMWNDPKTVIDNRHPAH